MCKHVSTIPLDALSLRQSNSELAHRTFWGCLGWNSSRSATRSRPTAPPSASADGFAGRCQGQDAGLREMAEAHLPQRQPKAFDLKGRIFVSRSRICLAFARTEPEGKRMGAESVCQTCQDLYDIYIYICIIYIYL